MKRLCIFLAAAAALFAQERPIVLRTSTLYDGRGGTQHNTMIVIEGSKIAQIGGPAPSNAIVYDLRALTITPGWIDTHSHIAYHFDNNNRNAGRGEPESQALWHMGDNAVKTLMAGFTTIQSPGSMRDKDLRDAIARGTIPGPRILTSLQPITNPQWDPAKMRATVDERKQQGADFIKLFASKSIREGGQVTLTQEQVNAVCGEAKAQGLRTIVHAHSAESAKESTLAGCTSVEHGAYVTDEVFNLMAEHGTYYDPNIGLVLQNYLENKPKFFGQGNYNEEGFAFMQKGIGITLETFKRSLKIKGLKIIYGTDAVAGAHGQNYREFIVRVRDGGMDPMRSLISVTSLSAESLNLGDQIGSIKPGMEADIVGFDGDPLKDPYAAGRCLFVMKGGKVFENLARGAKAGWHPSEKESR
jgi:imidazolonepropionase-like amidohydrolase